MSETMSRQQRRATERVLDAFRVRARNATRNPAFARIGPWSVAISVDEFGTGPLRVFSAQIKTPGSTPDDWRLLGEIVAAVGAPIEALRTPFDTTPPEATHYWIWHEDGRPVEEEAGAHFDRLIGAMRFALEER